MTARIPHDREEFYAELTARNRGLISAGDQIRLRRARLVIAGCGSTGGACVMPLVRTGAEHLVLLDPGTYELNNLNRQEATSADVGRNKAEATADRILAVNPHVAVDVHPEGVVPGAIGPLLIGAAAVVDAVDVTTDAGAAAKVALHAAACAHRLPVVTAYDIGATQFIELFDYRRGLSPLRGRVPENASADVLLRSVIPPWVLPWEILPVLSGRIADPARAFPQLAMTSTLLGALVVPYLIAVIAARPVRRRIRLDLNELVEPRRRSPARRARSAAGVASLWWRTRGA